MAHVFWRVINILGIILSLACLLLQVFAVLVGSWKGQEITVSRFEPTLFNVYMTRGNGLFTSTIDVAFVDSDGINELLSVKVINRHPMVTGDALRHCVVGPTLTHQLSVCNFYYQSDDCNCQLVSHWTAMVVLELISIPFLILLVICCFLLRTYSQRFLKTVTLFICAITGLVIMSGFILIFQYWDYDAQLLSHVLPYYIRMMLVQYYEMSFNELREGLQPYDKYYIADNIHIYPGWSAFISLVALITLIILGLFLAISWILDIRQYRLNRNNRGPTGTNLSAGSYKPIQQQI